MNHLKDWFAPFKKDFIQYTTFRRWLKAVISHYILSNLENYLVFGAWEQAIFVKPKIKRESGGNWHSKVIFKKNGKYDIKDEQFGFNCRFYTESNIESKDAFNHVIENYKEIDGQ